MTCVIKNGSVMLKFDVCLQKVAKKKRDPAIYLRLTGKARDAETDFNIETFREENGMDVISKKLDDAFLMDKNTHAYTVFKQFSNF